MNVFKTVLPTDVTLQVLPDTFRLISNSFANDSDEVFVHIGERLSGFLQEDYSFHDEKFHGRQCSHHDVHDYVDKSTNSTRNKT